MLLKIVVVTMLLLIVASLFSALLFLFKDKGRGGNRMAKALTWRIGLSLTLFILLMAGFHFGIIPQQGLAIFR